MSFTGALYAYPWDLTDGGLDRALDQILELTGCQEVVVTLRDCRTITWVTWYGVVTRTEDAHIRDLASH